MSRVAEMRGLTEEMARSYEERMSVLASRRIEVQDALGETRRHVAACHIARVDAAASLHKELAEAAARRRAEVNSTLQEIHVARAVNGSAQKAKLRTERADLSRQVNQLMGGTCQARIAMAANQQVFLMKGRVVLAAETAQFLSEASATRAAMAKSQQQALSAGRAALQTEVITTLEGFQQRRRDLANDLAEFSQVWQKFTQMRRARRSGALFGSSRTVEAEPQQLAAEVMATTPRRNEEEPMPSDPAAEGSLESHGIPSDEAVFSYLADHPDGLRLVDLEEHFGTIRIRLAPILSRLIQENKVRKAEDRKLYFAT
ncbi:MAG: hypothetical protein EPO21_20415 [Chloroflexota bacterium]|nr:MAG: hypothetical protein EPO21_20415 [Chloroflexota bacterium]